jgi:hypothetical protein
MFVETAIILSPIYPHTLDASTPVGFAISQQRGKHFSSQSTSMDISHRLIEFCSITLSRLIARELQMW